MIILVDDSTLDTVLECDVCGERMRYSFVASPTHHVHAYPDTHIYSNSADDSLSYLEFISWAMDNARFGHHCTAEVN